MRILWKKLAIIVIIIIFIDPIYTAGKAVVQQVITWTNNDEIETMLLSTKEKIIDVTAKLSENTSIETATPPIEDKLEEGVAVTAPAVKKPEAKLVVTNAKEMADAMYAYYSSFSPTFEIQYKGNTQRIEQLVEEAYENAIKRDDYVYGHISKHSIRFEYGGRAAKVFGEQSYLMTPEQSGYVEMNVQEVVASIDKQSLSNVEKVRAVNDYIVANTAYTDQTNSSPHSAYTVLAEHGGVCQGYALLAHSMLQKLGIETKYIVGYVGQEGHAWNLVKLDGQWYHLDTTWNDPVPDRKGAVRYQYFLVDDRTMAKDHTWIAEDYPKATSTKYNYFHNVDFAAKVGQQIFYSNVSENNKLYVLDLETGKSKRVSNSRAQYLVYADGWLYFSNYSHGAYLTKIRPDGSGEQILNREETKDLFVKDNYLYFTTNELKKIAL
ncbi:MULTISPECIES: transglutaminase domain-containing protein [unclassified Lysinibacillus]|uniref:transglutaminase domain-containing protein n=1 Tax=unclassified Lysinibacillus TaxID=2636778 RepID=UPI001F0A4F7B|nr:MULTISPECIES: transglutaminase domain-containing protein [unclassified Lysinibacillus]